MEQVSLRESLTMPSVLTKEDALKGMQIRVSSKNNNHVSMVRFYWAKITIEIISLA